MSKTMLFPITKNVRDVVEGEYFPYSPPPPSKPKMIRGKEYMLIYSSRVSTVTEKMKIGKNVSYLDTYQHISFSPELSIDLKHGIEVEVLAKIDV